MSGFAVKPAFKEAMHRYMRLHKQIMNRDPAIPAKYIVLRPSGQLCNRIRAVVAVFTLAFLTDRAFVVESFGIGQTGYYDLFLDPGFKITDAKNIPRGGSKVQLNGDVKSAELFTCSNWTSNEHQVLRFSGATYINTYLYRNPFFQRKLRALFLDDDLYRPMLSWLFQPVPEAIAAKDEFLRSLPRSYMVGFHIRTVFPISKDEWTAYRDCAVAVTPPHARANATWFVATDSVQGRAWAREKLSPSVRFFSPDEFVKGSLKRGQFQALVDILVASESDALFLSPHSSYSRVVSLYAQTPHAYLVTDHVKPERDPHRILTEVGRHCYRFTRKEDCAWHGHRTSVAADLSRISCYTPAMVPDYC